MQPWPPSPALTVILASSMNMMNHRDTEGTERSRYPSDPSLCLCVSVVLLHRLDRNKSAGCALILELHNPGNLCEQRIVFPDTDIQAGFELRAPLPDEDRT